MSIILFDTETTGLVKSVASPVRIQPRIIEFFALKLDIADLRNPIDELHLLIDPGQPRDQWPVIKDLGENGSMITEEMLAGAPRFPGALHRLQEFFLGARTMVAHNLSFDRDMLTQELQRIDAVTRFPWPPEHICTVEASEQIAGRRMSLSDLHTHLFGEGFDEAHLASKDVAAMHRCFVALCERGAVRL